MANPNDAEGRPLTDGEFVDAEAVFGDAIDYTQVRIHDGDYWGYGNDVLTTFEGEIFIPEAEYQDDFSLGSLDERAAFLHEMTHVWQDQNFIGYNDDIAQALAENGGNYDALYDYVLAPGKSFFNYNNEQQGIIVEDYFRAANNRPIPGNKNSVDDYEGVLPFDQDGGERLVPIVPATDAPGALGYIGSQPETPSDPAAQQIPSTPQSPGAPALSDSGVADAGPPLSETAPSAAPPQLGSSPESVAPPTAVEPPQQTAPEGVSTAQPLTPEDIAGDPELAADQRYIDENGDVQGGDNTRADNTRGETPADYDDRPQDEIGEEMEAVLRGDDSGADDDSEDEDEPEQAEAGSGDEMPNPVDDPSPGNGDFSVLVNRNAPYTNPGAGDFDMPDVGGDLSDLLNRTAPAVNPGSGDFDMPSMGGDASILLNRSAPVTNPGLFDIDMPVGGDLSDLLDRNGPRQTLSNDAESAVSSPSDDLFSDLDFGGDLGGFAGFDIL